jgi:hypothetical protein
MPASTICTLGLETGHSAIGQSPHFGKRSSVLQEWQVLDGDLPFPAWLANVGFVPGPAHHIRPFEDFQLPISDAQVRSVR